jgi:uncharacterized membrane protein
MFNHLPIVGLGFAILLNLFAVFGKSQEIRRLSCWFYILVALLSILSLLTGDSAGDIIRSYPGISNDAIESHENWGYIFFYGLLVNSLIAIVALWFFRKNEGLMKKLNIAMLIVALMVAFLAFQAGMTGGKIRHPEIEQGILKKG